MTGTTMLMVTIKRIWIHVCGKVRMIMIDCIYARFFKLAPFYIDAFTFIIIKERRMEAANIDIGTKPANAYLSTTTAPAE